MPTIRTLARIASIAAICISLHAQTGKTISVQLRDGKTGKLITPSNFLLRIDHHDAVHNEWVKINDDGTVQVTVPDDAKEISLQATYNEGMDYYVNCDAAKQADKERELWYPIAVIMKSGAVAPNECGRSQYSAQAGQFIFFVRKRGALDQLHD